MLNQIVVQRRDRPVGVEIAASTDLIGVPALLCAGGVLPLIFNKIVPQRIQLPIGLCGIVTVGAFVIGIPAFVCTGDLPGRIASQQMGTQSTEGRITFAAFRRLLAGCRLNDFMIGKIGEATALTFGLVPLIVCITVSISFPSAFAVGIAARQRCAA